MSVADTSGDAIRDMMESEGFALALRDILPDEADLVADKLREWCDGGEVDVVLTTGGTGLGPRDVTPEATQRVLDFEVPGIAEAMRMQTLRHTPMAMLSRSVAGVRSGCLIVNLPGSPEGRVGNAGDSQGCHPSRPGDDPRLANAPGQVGTARRPP